MQTIAYLFIIAGLLAVRAVFKGRVDEIPQDLGKFITALLTFDVKGLMEVASLETTPKTSVSNDVATDAPSAATANTTLLSTVQALGAKATKGYSQDQDKRTGPDYYDCSGLVYRGMVTMGYDVKSFWTGNFRSAASKYISKINAENAQPGDIVIWTGHMGVVAGNGQAYAAKSKKSGIGTQSIAGVTKSKGKPEYYRLISKMTPVGS